MMSALVFLLSLAALAFEVLIARFLAISQWNALSFMVISLALFGFAASGTVHSLCLPRKAFQRLPARALAERSAVMYALCQVGSLLIITRIPLDYFRLPLEPMQVLYLLIAYLLLALPFFFAGFVVSLAYTDTPERSGWIYCLNMLGSGLGILAPVLLLPFIGEMRLMMLIALVPLPPVLFKAIFSKTDGRVMNWMTAVIIVGIVVAMPTTRATNMEVKPSSYKALSQQLLLPDTRITETRRSIRGRIDRVTSPFIRSAPGLSLKHAESLPPQDLLFQDGDLPLALYDLDSPNAAAFARMTLPYAGYLMTPRPKKVLLIVHDGGASVPCAKAAGASDIRIIHPHPDVAAFLSKRYSCDAITENPRAYLRKTPETWSVIQIDHRGASIPGAGALDLDPMLTVEGLASGLSRLDPGGVLILSRNLLLPPSDTLRFWATAYEALKRLGVDVPSRHLAVLRNWDMYTLIAARSPIRDPSALHRFAADMNFDLVYLPDLSPDEANRFNIFDQAHHFNELRRLTAAYDTGNAEAFFAQYLLDVAPRHDSRPFPGRILKWRHLPELYRTLGSRLYSLWMSSELVVWVVLGEAVFLALILMAVPSVARRRETHGRRWTPVLFFWGIGLGFMLTETYFIGALTLWTGDDIVSFAMVLLGILTFSGAGGLWSQRLGPVHLRRVLWMLLVVPAVLFALSGAVTSAGMGLAPSWRYAAAFAWMLVPGVLLGIPFSLGMRHLARTPEERAGAWAANGCASVIAAIAAYPVNLMLGIPWLLVGAMLGYGGALAAICFTGRRSCGAAGVSGRD